MGLRRSSIPPQLRKFVNAVEENARTAGYTAATAGVFGAWAACFVRFCTLDDRSWRDPDHVPAFLDYLEDDLEVEASSRERAVEALEFLFEKLLRADIQDATWRSGRRSEGDSGSEEASPSDSSTSKEDEQSPLLTRLLFHTSLSIHEAHQLCGGDVDLEAGLIYVSDATGTPKRVVEVPETLEAPLKRRLQRLRKEQGRRYIGASLFQARALQGRVENG